MPVYKWGEEDSEADCCTWILRAFIWSVFVGVGIFLIIFGCDELATCEHSMLPMFILVTGCTIVAGCALSLLAAVILGCQLSWRNGGYYLLLLYSVSPLPQWDLGTIMGIPMRCWISQTPFEFSCLMRILALTGIPMGSWNSEGI